MNPIEHFFIGWYVANASPELNRRERLAITAAAVIPDVDGLGMLVEIPTRHTSSPLYWWTDYHHILAHNIAAAVAVTLLAALVARRKFLTGALAFISFHTHIFGDVVGARGPDGFQWPIPYFFPFSRTPELVWRGQWPLNGWQNFAITALALALTFRLAWKRGCSPLEIVSPAADARFVATLRARFS